MSTTTTTVTVILLLSCISGELGNKDGILSLQFLCYNNNDHKGSSGTRCDYSTNCDPSFRICLSNHHIPYMTSLTRDRCTLYYLQTSPYPNAGQVCKGNRGALATTITRRLRYPLQETYYLRIDVEDIDSFSAPDSIAVFSSNLSIVPAVNRSSVKLTHIQMSRAESTYHNPSTRLTVAVAVQCARDFYGRHCMTQCENDVNFNCGPDGTKICNEGWRGIHCDLRDLCLYKACSDNATCMEIDGQAQCICNGVIGLQCEPNFDPCLGLDCLNNGSCVPSHVSSNSRARCLCEYPWTGSVCGELLDLCRLTRPHCSRLGTLRCRVANDSTERVCHCQPGWIGDICDTWLTPSTSTTDPSTRVPQAAIDVRFNVLLAVFLAVVALLVVVASAVLVRHRKRMSDKLQLEHVTMSDLKIKLKDKRSSSNLAFYTENEENNTIYTVTGNDGEYEVVNDNNCPYATVTDEDDYLVPRSGGFVDNIDTYVHMDLETSKQFQETQPPLPSRDNMDGISKKLSLRLLCAPGSRES